MNIGNTFDLVKLRRLQAFRRRRAAARSRPEQEPALRSELFSAAQMERQGQILAGQHQLSEKSSVDLLLSRLTENESVLIHACERLTAATRRKLPITPAAEWLLDNLYLVEEQIRLARQHLPKGYSRELPRLASGPSVGLPRVYDIALEIISHGDGRVSVTSLRRFVRAYQEVSPLKLGELWAIPIMLRLALIENLRRVAARVMADWRYRGKAARWADAMAATAERDPNSVVLVVADMARSDPPMVGPFVAEMARRLQGQSPALALPLSWIEQKLAETGRSIEHLVQLEAAQQAASQVSISNSIGSLRELAAINWRDFIEQTSQVEARLREDPAGIYGAMDFATRDRYRHVVESIGRKHRLPESAVADAAIELCRESSIGRAVRFAASTRRLLPDRLRPARAGAAPGRAADALPRRARRRGSTRHRWRSTWACWRCSRLVLPRRWWPPRCTIACPCGHPGRSAVPAVILASQLGLSLLNWLATLSVTPQRLPRMDYAGGIPAAARTLVAVPTLFNSARRTGRAAGGAGSSLPGQSRPAHPFRPAHRFPRRGQRNPAHGRAAAATGPAAHRVRSTCVTPRPMPTAFSCCIARDAGTRASNAGWATSASAASWPISTPCCAVAARSTSS